MITVRLWRRDQSHLNGESQDSRKYFMIVLFNTWVLYPGGHRRFRDMGQWVPVRYQSRLSSRFPVHIVHSASVVTIHGHGKPVHSRIAPQVAIVLMDMAELKTETSLRDPWRPSCESKRPRSVRRVRLAE